MKTIVIEDLDDYYEGEICSRSEVSKEDGTMMLTFEVDDGWTHKKRISINLKAMHFLEWFGKEDIDKLKSGIKQYVDSQ